jgi:hypothetical protein
VDDLEMPIIGGALVDESFVYRVRDRKKRDVLRMARVTLVTVTPAEEVAAFYTRVLGADAARETNKDTGEITLTTGTRDNLRLVVIAPKPGSCHVRQERLQQFTIPPRTFTEAEQRVVRVFSELAQTYAAAARLTYTMEQQVELSPAMGETKPPVLHWEIDYARPATLALTAHVGETLGLQIATKEGALLVTRPGREDETRPIKDAISLETVPELGGDPVARLILGEDLLASADYLALSAVKDVPPHQQVLMTLTFPEEEMTLTLLIDRRRNAVLRSEVLLTGPEGRWTRTVRTYANLHIEPATSTIPHRSQTEPPAVTGP